MNTIREYAAPIVWTEESPNPGDVAFLEERDGSYYYLIGDSGYEAGGTLVGKPSPASIRRRSSASTSR